MSTSNCVKNVAVVGAGGNIGTFISNSLLATGKHVVTAITRNDSKSKIPEGVKSVAIDYDDQNSIVEALRSQDALVITLGFFAPRDLQERLIRAAADAHVPWILPNEWGMDSEHPGITRDISSVTPLPGARQLIHSLGQSSYMAVVTGLWYEWGLSDPALFHIDAINEQALLYDDGKTKISTTTWPQLGRAVAALLSLPIKSHGNGDKRKCLEHFRNQMIYLDSFTVSQREMLESVYRVTGTTEAEWSITNADSHEYFEEGFNARKQGDFNKGRQVYARLFFDDLGGNHKERRGLANTLLNLPVEDMDEATKTAMDWQKRGGPAS